MHIGAWKILSINKFVPTDKFCEILIARSSASRMLMLKFIDTNVSKNGQNEIENFEKKCHVALVGTCTRITYFFLIFHLNLSIFRHHCVYKLQALHMKVLSVKVTSFYCRTLCDVAQLLAIDSFFIS